jgi:hypothetical protein
VVHACAGFFQPEEGQFSCINCDSLGNAYQEQEARSFCHLCASNTQRYVGVLSALNRSSCQCKEGASSEHTFVIRWRPTPLRCVQATMPKARRQERCVPLFEHMRS